MGFLIWNGGFCTQIGAIDQSTQTVTVVHECQVLDEDLKGEEWDTGCDFVTTGRRVIEIQGARKPECGILWDKLGRGMEEGIEPLGELRRLVELGT